MAKKSMSGWAERMTAVKGKANIGPGKSYPVRPNDCASFRAAYTQAMAQKRGDIARKALTAGLRLNCSWAQSHKTTSKEEA
jgi:hypothetical protein